MSSQSVSTLNVSETTRIVCDVTKGTKTLSLFLYEDPQMQKA